MILFHFEAHGQDAPPGSSPDQERIELTVQQGDTCESIAARLYGAERFYFIVLDALGTAPDILRSTCNRALQPGMILSLPRRIPSDRRPSDAHVTAVVREVRSRPPDAASWGAARRGQRLYRAWRVNTLRRSEAEITFRDESAIQIREETLVIIFGPTAEKARRTSSKAVLKRGALKSRLGELRGRREIHVKTPSARAHLNGGEAVVSVDAEETSRVANHTGRPARVRSAKGGGSGEVLVPAGMGTTVKRGGRPERPRPLLSAPDWAPNQRNLYISVGGQPQTLLGSWLPVEGAQSYRVAVFANQDGSEPVASTETPPEIHRFELQEMEPGSYSVTVSAIDARGLEGPPSERREIRVALLSLIPLREAGDELESPASTQGPPPVPTGTKLSFPEGLHCTRDDEPPSHELILTGSGLVELRCIDDEEREASSLRLMIVPDPISRENSSGNEGQPTTAPTPQPDQLEPDPPETGADPTRSPSPWRPSETWGLLSAPFAIGLHDERREGSGIWLSLALIQPDQVSHVEHQITLGVRLSVLDERFRMQVGIPLGATDRMSGLAVAFSSRIVAASRWGLALELGTWLPFSSIGSTDEGSFRPHLTPAADLSFKAHERVLLRSRQGVQFELADDADVLWTSAYGIDLQVVGPFSIGAEAVLLLGRLNDELHVAPGLGLALTLGRGIWAFSVGLRGGLTDDAAQHMGRFSFLASLRVGGMNRP